MTAIAFIHSLLTTIIPDNGADSAMRTDCVCERTQKVVDEFGLNFEGRLINGPGTFDLLKSCRSQ